MGAKRRGRASGALHRCHQAPRVYTTVKINNRTGKQQILENRMASVQTLR
jgi:uncharacterized protein YqgV (UPF0045/DUF77 family)